VTRKVTLPGTWPGANGSGSGRGAGPGRRPRPDARLHGRRGAGRDPESGEVHFHSRSRGRCGARREQRNVLRLRGIEVDCDGDALLIAVDPAGPLHRDVRSCLIRNGHGRVRRRSSARDAAGFAWLESLWATIDARASACRPSPIPRAARRGSTALAQGHRRGDEVLMAARTTHRAGGRRAATRDALAGEVADLLYHTAWCCCVSAAAPGRG